MKILRFGLLGSLIVTLVVLLYSTDAIAENTTTITPTNDPRYLHTTDISNIEDHNRSEIAHFFQVYKDLEGKKVEIIGWEFSKQAKQVIVESIKRYKDTIKKY